MPDSSTERRTDEPAHPAADTGDRGHAGAGDPRRDCASSRTAPAKSTPRWSTCRQRPMIFRATSTRKSRARPSFTTAWRAPATSTRSDKAACSAFLSAVREEYPQFTGILTINPDGSLFCNSLRTNRTLDLQGSRLFQAGPGRERDRHAAAGVRPADGDIGVADRLPRALGNRRAEIHPARLVQSAEIRGVSRQTPVQRSDDENSARRQEGHGPRRARKGRLGPSRPAPRSRTPSCSGLRPHRTASRSAR